MYVWLGAVVALRGGSSSGLRRLQTEEVLCCERWVWGLEALWGRHTEEVVCMKRVDVHELKCIDLAPDHLLLGKSSAPMPRT